MLGVLDDHVRIVVVNASMAEAPAVQVVASNDTQVAQLRTASAVARQSVPSKAIPPLTSYLR